MTSNTKFTVEFNGEEYTLNSQQEYLDLLKTSKLVGKKCRLVRNLECFIGYEGQELQFMEELPENYCVVSDGANKWWAGIEETNLFDL